jgi:hypothetical protein
MAREVGGLLTSLDADGTQSTLERLPARLRARLDALAPLRHLEDIRAPLIVLAHDATVRSKASERTSEPFASSRES